MSPPEPAEHHIVVDGKRIVFSMCEDHHGRFLVKAPGVMHFCASSLDEARDIVRSLFARKQED